VTSPHASLDPHAESADVAFSDAGAIADALAAGTTTSVEVVRTLLARIEAVDGPGHVHLRAVLAVCPDALEQARAPGRRAARPARCAARCTACPSW